MVPLPPKKDIDGLIRAVQGPLGLSPGRSDLPPEIEADIRQTLSGPTSVAKGIGALRTHGGDAHGRSEEHTSELQSLMRISYAVFCLKKKKTTRPHLNNTNSSYRKHEQ